MKKADIGMIGLAVMGENLALNMESKGFTVAVYNRTVPGKEEGVVERFMEGRGAGKQFIGSDKLDSFVQSLERPRKVMMMVRAGAAVDYVIQDLLPLLEPGDIIIDGGNSNYPDSKRRTTELAAKGIHFVGAGVSGGEEGALKGPSIMPGGASAAWEHLKPIFQAISAQVNGEPCCNWIGEGGAGHFVKMVHNGIEYGDMQIISEGYHILRELAGFSPAELSTIFARWNKEELNSYLIEITADILAYEEEGKPLIDLIKDSAGQKGTGKWTGITALDIGVPLTLIGEAVFARCLSSYKEERVRASGILKGPDVVLDVDKQELVNSVKDALYGAKMISYAQGYLLFKEAAAEHNWDLDYGVIAKLWRGGCIIRSGFLDKIAEAYEKNPGLENLILDDYFKEALAKTQEGWRKVVQMAVGNGIPMPSISAALAYYDGYRSAVLPANILQAQRDYFGAHTYERIDKPAGTFFHTNWTGEGGSTSSSTYNV